MRIFCYFQLHDHRREQGNKRKLLLSKGEGRQCATMSLSSAFQHRGVNLNAWNRQFAVELSGARPRRWKSEFLSIIFYNF